MQLNKLFDKYEINENLRKNIRYKFSEITKIYQKDDEGNFTEIPKEKCFEFIQKNEKLFITPRLSTKGKFIMSFLIAFYFEIVILFYSYIL